MKKLAIILVIFAFFLSSSRNVFADGRANNTPVPTISISAHPMGFCGRLRFVSILWILPGGVGVKKVQDRIEQGIGKDYTEDPEYYFLPVNVINESIIKTSSPRSSRIKPEVDSGYIIIYQTIIVRPYDHIKFLLKANGKYYQPLICDSLLPFINFDGCNLCQSPIPGEWEIEIP